MDDCPVALPSELAFWALWHCRHARPPDSCLSRWLFLQVLRCAPGSNRQRLRVCL